MKHLSGHVFAIWRGTCKSQCCIVQVPRISSLWRLGALLGCALAASAAAVSAERAAHGGEGALELVRTAPLSMPAPQREGLCLAQVLRW